MATGIVSKGRMKIGGLLIGGDPSDGGKGAIGGTGTPTWIKKFAVVTSGTITPGALTTGLSTSANVTVTGCVAGDLVIATPPSNFGSTGVTWSTYISASNTVTIVITNGTGGTITPGAGAWKVAWFQLV